MHASEIDDSTATIAPLWRRFVELLAASAFAVAQPLYVRLSTQSPFLLDTGTTPLRIVALTVAIYLGLPLLLCGVEWLVGLRSPRLATIVHQLSVAGLVFLLSLLIARQWSTTNMWWINLGVQGYLTVLGAAIVGVGMARWMRRRWMQQLLLIGACGSVLFPIQFVRTGAAASVLTPPGPPLDVRAGHPAPVVVLIFDEFSGMSLLNENREIDAVRYPNFARLAATGNWYRNASTVHVRTNYAVPALLTGRMPLGDRETTLTEAPQNLFTLLQSAGYSTTAFEPVSRLHPPPLIEMRSGVSVARWCTAMGRALTSVFLQAVTPEDLPVSPPAIPAIWHGLTERPGRVDDRTLRTGVFRDASVVDAQFEHFLDCLPQDDVPALCVLHAMTPHCPWQFLPSGERYVRINDCSTFPLANFGGLAEDWVEDELPVRQAWQRYLLQIGDVDRRVGMVLDRLEEAGILDETLLVIAGDHGVSFRPGMSRRLPDGDNLADILSVPLFIKLPGQQAGIISDRNVESIDVLPTIAAALAIELPLPVDGDSLLDESIPSRARKTLNLEFGSTVASSEFPERFGALERMLETFGSGSQNDRLWASLGPRTELHGRRVDEFGQTAAGTVEVELVDSTSVRTDESQSACLLLGRVIEPASEPMQLALAVRGRIIGTTETTIDPQLPGRWSCLVTQLEEAVECEDVQIFVIRADGDGVTLEACAITLLSGWET